MTFDPEKFIKKFEEGKFGYAIRHPYHKKLLYRAALLKYPVNLDERTRGAYHTRNVKERDLEHHFMFIAENNLSSGGSCAWVDNKGFPTFVLFGGHMAVCETFFGQLEENFEKTHAKVTETCKTVEDCIKYVDKPTKAMERACARILSGELSEQPNKEILE